LLWVHILRSGDGTRHFWVVQKEIRYDVIACLGDLQLGTDTYYQLLCDGSKGDLRYVWPIH
jgi:hypothetical protein